jgi:serine/threonine protein kinase
MERQSADIRLKCPTCGLAVQSCTCNAAATIKSSERALQPGFAEHAGVSPRLVAAQTCSEIGSIVGDNYELVAELGSGGMGTVFKAKHVNLPKFFAIKILRRDLSNDPDFRARFLQEARTASLLNHPHLVSIYDYGTTDYGEAFLVMDFIDGHSLADALEKLKRIEQRQAVKAFIQICEGLAHAHGLGVIHRDLKPSNVMLVNTREASDVVKIVDFGIAKMVGADGSIAHITQSLTKTGEFFGSPLYMSPEQGNGGNPDNRTDIYSMGVLMYECLTSAPPFRGDNFFFTMMLHNEASPKPFEKALGISEDLEKIVFKALEKNPDDRYQSMEEMRLALIDVFDDEKVSSKARRGSRNSASKGADRGKKERKKEDGKDQGTSNWPLISGCLVALLLSTAAAYWFFSHNQATPAPPPAAATQAPASNQSGELEALAPLNLPSIPETVRLPESAKNMTPLELISAGEAASKEIEPDYQNLLPARYFTTALMINPSLDNAYLALMKFYWNQQEHSPANQRMILEKCLMVYKEHIKHNPNNLDTYIWGGTINQCLHRWPDVIAITEAGLKLSPETADLHMKHGYALSELNKNQEAADELEKYMSRGDSGARWIVGSCYRDLNQNEKAIEFASKWIKQVGPEAGLLMIRGDSEKDLKRYNDAIRDYEELTKRWPEHSKSRGGQLEECRKLNASPGKN